NARAAMDIDTVVADLATRSERPFGTGAAWNVAGRWSPNGAQLLVMRVLDNTNQELLIVDPRTGEARDITRHEDDVQHIPAGWLGDGRVLEITDQGSEHLWLAALDPKDGRREAVDHPNWDVELAVSSADG